MLQVVWFKRDLRVDDHAPLCEAARRGPVLPLYIVEPAAWRQPDMAGRHWDFVRESLLALRDALAALGQPLVVRTGDADAVLGELLEAYGRFALWSHEETGNAWSFARDRAVRAWCAERGIVWNELRQFGVFRGLSDRNGWAARWEAQMRAARCVVPAALSPLPDVVPGVLPASPFDGMPPDDCPHRQRGGIPAAEALRDSFLAERGSDYRRGMSSPLAAEGACSRLSPHLAWGTLSLRGLVQAARDRRAALDPADPAVRPLRASLAAFDRRLHWHCHFIQKLESEPRIEFSNVHPAYDGLREADWNDAHFSAWCAGRTGWPFVDACMRYLRAQGWINFRMRAMLMAVASYHLWLHWRAPALFLARQFTDYEPGIHYNQVQMQSGTTGINTVRIYNPVKQGYEQDPEGCFVRRWVPELAGVPGAMVHEPWRLGVMERRAMGVDGYPEPLLDHLAAARAARERVWAVRREPGYREQADGIQRRHGSRRSGMASMRRSRRRTSPSPQHDLDLGE